MFITLGVRAGFPWTQLLFHVVYIKYQGACKPCSCKPPDFMFSPPPLYMCSKRHIGYRHFGLIFVQFKSLNSLSFSEQREALYPQYLCICIFAFKINQKCRMTAVSTLYIHLSLIKALKSCGDWLSRCERQTTCIKISPGTCSKTYSLSPPSTIWSQFLAQGPRTLHFNKSPCWFSGTRMFENYCDWTSWFRQSLNSRQYITFTLAQQALHAATFTERLGSSSIVCDLNSAVPTPPPPFNTCFLHVIFSLRGNVPGPRGWIMVY